MKKYFGTIASVAFLAIALLSCEQKKKSIDTSSNITPEQLHEVTIYGSENCDHCIDFRKKMDSLNFTYTFKDAEASENYYNELLAKIQAANFKGYVAFPVLEVDGQLYVKPEFSQIQTLLTK